MAFQLDPFRHFFQKMNNDLASWLQQESETQQLLQDYSHLQAFLQQHFDAPKLLVELGPDCRLKAKRNDDMVILRMKADLWVEMDSQEALPALKDLVALYEEKVVSCRREINKIMASMREMESLIASYQELI